MLNYSTLKDAFPSLRNNKETKHSSIDDNVKLSNKIIDLEKREVIKSTNEINDPIDMNVNKAHKQMYDDLDEKYKKIVNSLKDEIIILKDQEKQPQPSNRLLEGFSFDNNTNQFNELLLYIATAIFIIHLIDYMYQFGKKSF